MREVGNDVNIAKRGKLWKILDIMRITSKPWWDENDGEWNMSQWN